MPCDQLTLCPTTTAPDPLTGTSTGDGTTQGPLTTSTSDPNTPADPCDGVGDGPHCGGELGGLADHSSLYQCAGGSTQSATPCPGGCEAGGCKPIAQDPCASAMSGNGLYCGGTLMGGNVMVLYNCQNGATAGQNVLQRRLQGQPAGRRRRLQPRGRSVPGGDERRRPLLRPELARR
ncbi:hypothetical protein [Nannocystis pusilla]|uniref:hypothetical protein n=1 Tax=Nannocystis pusilla TaxID=889268 RepID=UPI003DA53949